MKKLTPEIVGFTGSLLAGVPWKEELIGLIFAIIGYFVARGLYRLFKERFERFIDKFKKNHHGKN